VQFVCGTAEHQQGADTLDPLQVLPDRVLEKGSVVIYGRFVFRRWSQGRPDHR